MRFQNELIKSRAIAEVVIPRPEGQDNLCFKVRALSYGEDKVALTLFPDASPPFNFLKDESGLPLRNDDGKVIHGPLYDDPGYVTMQAHAEDMRVVVKLALALDADERITWETKEPAGSTSYYEAIKDELTKAGLSYGDLAIIVRKANQLGNVDADAVERAAEAFSAREQALKDVVQ